MKRLLKAIARAIWRLTGPFRRPVVRRLDNHLSRLVDGSIEGRVVPRLEAIAAALARIEGFEGGLRGVEHAINVARCTSDAHAADANLLMDSVVRELARLQMQVEVLQQAVQEGVGAGDGLSIVGQAEAEVA
jgi:hypothetical protein